MLKLSKEIVSEFFHRLPRVSVVHLQFLEADFVPYYVVSRNLLPETYKAISFSSDKDLFQQVVLPNFVMQIRQLPVVKDKRKLFITWKNALYAITNKESFLQLDEELLKVLDSNIPLALAIAGDTDEFKGVPRIGYITVFNTITKLIQQDRSLLELFDLRKDIATSEESRLNRLHEILEVLAKEVKGKVWQNLPAFFEVIEKNFKLADFEMLSLYVDTHFIEAKEYIENQIGEIDISMDLETFDYALTELLSLSDTQKRNLLQKYEKLVDTGETENSDTEFLDELL
jgi:hypothetical protein